MKTLISRYCPLAATIATIRALTKSIVSFSIISISLLSAHSQTTWTGADSNDWNTAGNWTSGIPTLSASANILLANANVTMSGVGNVNVLTVRSDVVDISDAPVMNISQNLTINHSIRVGSQVSTANTNRKGIIRHTSGTVDLISPAGGRRLEIAASANDATSGNVGIYEFGGLQSSAPIFQATGSGSSVAVNIGMRPGEHGTLILKDYGSFSIPNNMLLAINSSVSPSAANVHAILRVEGGNLDFSIGGDLEFSTEGGGGASRLEAVLTNSGFSTINVGGNVRFGRTNAGTDNSPFFSLILGDDFVYQFNTTYTILQAAGNFTGTVNHFRNLPNGSEINVGGHEFFAFYINEGGFNKFILTTPIPEPSSLGLLALAAGLGWARWKRGKRARSA